MQKVMLAEDDATMLSLLNTLLKLEGFQPIPLSVEKDIVAEVAAQRPEVLLMDVNLTNKNGIEELRRLRAHPDGIQVRVVMASGYNVAEECLRNGADAFLLKPFMPDDLFAALRGTK